MSTLLEKDFIEIFKGSLKINTRSISIKTLLSDRNLRRINYKPYYQRNYVWDNEKQSFFIESVILGTEIPPLILFKSSSETEVIDGRQRFETLRKFKENEITLTSKGLMSLQALSKKNFNKLDEEIKEIFWNSNIRVFEFEIITTVSPLVEDKIKKEIFRRYNTGITPLTSEEVDNAKYDDDDLSDVFDKELKEKKEFYQNVKNCFFPNEKEDASLIGKMVNYLRRLNVLNKFPISKYASGTGREEIIEILYETTIANTDNVQVEFKRFYEQLENVFIVYNLFKKDNSLVRNKLIYEALLWAFMIIDEENVIVDINDRFLDQLKEHYLNSLEVYQEDNSYFYKNIIDRFQDTANFFSFVFNINFDIYIRNNDFKDKIKELKQSDDQARNVIEQLEGLRINKPNPISKPIEEILSDVIGTKYLIRPSYQRQEKVSILKASSIIESILLGIYLPPIFVFKRNGVKEVIDGQQRLLSIIAFIGKQYRNEENKLVYSKNNNFKLKGLNILNLNGKSFSSLTSIDQDKILDFDFDEIVIEESINPQFDPTDLFIRLNQKPYPIKQNSFEMWNSTVDREIIKKLKEVTEKHIDWFYFKDFVDSENRTDRMENEELITILSYISYGVKNNSVEKILGLFKRIDRVTCRLKNKTGLTEFLDKLEENINIKEDFTYFIEKTDKLITFFGHVLSDNPTKETLTSFFNLRRSTAFRKSYQDFYIVWLVLNSVDIDNINANTSKDLIKSQITNLLKTLRNLDNKEMDDAYFRNFIEDLNGICKTKFTYN